MTLYSAFRNYLTWCLDLAFREICTFSLELFTGANTIESSRKLLKQSHVKICCVPAALLKRGSGAVVSCSFRENFQNTCFKEHHCATARKFISI